MAYDKTKVYRQALEVIDNPNIFFIQDLVDYIGIAKSTFYSLFPEDSNESNTLKEKLLQNRMEKKIEIRAKLGKGTGTELIALYKLLCHDDERRNLSTNWNENQNSGNITINWHEE
jgi:hypothetical protein